jgi:hypothetical protein
VFSQDASGEIVASRLEFKPVSHITPSDIFQNGLISWSTRSTFPYVGGRQNEVWAASAVKGNTLLMIYLTDYVTWNTPISLQYERGQARIRHCCDKYGTPANGYIDGYGEGDRQKSQINTNYKVIVPATGLGYDKCIVFKFLPYDGGVIDLDDRGSSDRGATIYLGLVDLARKSLQRMPMSNIHDQGRICLHPSGSATALTPLPHAIFDEFAKSPGNRDLASTSLLSPLYLEPVAESEDENGEPWLELKTEKPGQAYGSMAMQVPNFWAAFTPLIDAHLAKVGKPAATKKK